MGDDGETITGNILEGRTEFHDKLRYHKVNRNLVNAKNINIYLYL